MAIIPAATMRYRSHDQSFPFYQDPDFRYLTDFPEPDAIAVLRPGHDKPFTLFVLPRDPAKETWTGRRFGVEGAKERFGADASHELEEFEKALPDLLSGYDALYYRPGRRPSLDHPIQSTLEKLRAKTRDGVRVPWAIVDPGTVLHEHRLIKGPEEIDAIRRAVAVSAAGHLAAMRFIRAGLLELDVQAVLEYVFKRHGAEDVAFDTVVAAGANACILHYPQKQSRLEDGDLLLMDAGALLDGYSGDITRTVPISGKFSPAQRRLYDIVLAALCAAGDETRPGRDIGDVHAAAVRVLTEGMVDAGLLEGEVDQLISDKEYNKYYTHRTSHWLGMDVHDVGRYFETETKTRTLEAGMALTIEPGIYVPSNDTSAPEEYRGIGIRIEDDFLVTPDGAENLSSAIPRAATEIERLMEEPFDPPA